MLLSIKTTKPTINIRQTDAKLTIHQPKASFNVKVTPVQMNFKNTPAQVRISTQGMRESLGLRGPLAEAKYDAQLGREAALEFAGRAGREGHMQLVSRNPRQTLAAIMRGRMQNQYPSPPMRIPAPVETEISWTEPKISTDISPQRIKINWDTHPKAQISATRAKTEITVPQPYPWIKVEYLGRPEDILVVGTGKNMNIKV